MARGGVTVNASKEPLRCNSAHFGDVVRDHGYRWMQHVGESEVVEADKRSIVTEAALMQGPDGAERELVAQCEKRGRWVCQIE